MSRTVLIIPSSGTIDMYDDVSTPLTFNIADIRNPDKRNANFSKTIKVPGTANNNRMFGYLFNVNATTLMFNPNLKTECILLIDDEEQMRGFLRLTDIGKTDDNLIEYSVTIMGNVGNPFAEMGNSLLTDLDFSAGDHDYTYAVQVASWANTYADLYCYPLIDYGFNDDLSEVDVEDLLPAIFLKAYVLKIFESIGYTYTSTFFDSTFFNNLIIPANGGTMLLNDAQIQDNIFAADLDTVSSGTNIVVYDTEQYDAGGVYDPVTGEYTANFNGYYNLYASAYITLETLSANSWVLFAMQKKPAGSGTWQFFSPYFQQSVGFGFTTVATAEMTNVFLNNGDKIRVIISLNPSFPTTGTLLVTDGSFRNEVVNNGFVEGDVVSLDSVVPTKIKQKDLMLNIIKMFNLYVDVDSDNPRNLIIETRDDFYASGDIVDWSAKLDHDKEINYNLMGALDFKELIYTYADDNDYYNKKYKDKYGETYGRYRAINDNEFLTTIQENKVIFSATPLVGDASNDRIIPRIWDVDSSNSVSAKAFNIRLLYNGGVFNTLNTYDYSGRYSGSHLINQYLYAGHLDNPANPTLDLNFGVPQEIFYNTTVYTNNNLFNRFHKSFFEDITNPESRVVTAYFYLTKTDIRTLDFRNIFYFDGQYFRLNKIPDYDPIKHEVTKCEFLKINNPNIFAGGQTNTLGGYYPNYEDGYPLQQQ